MLGPGHPGRGYLRSASHDRYGFASRYELAKIDGDPRHTRYENIIPATSTLDQELAIANGINNLLSLSHKRKRGGFRRPVL